MAPPLYQQGAGALVPARIVALEEGSRVVHWAQRAAVLFTPTQIVDVTPWSAFTRTMNQELYAARDELSRAMRVTLWGQQPARLPTALPITPAIQVLVLQKLGLLERFNDRVELLRDDEFDMFVARRSDTGEPLYVDARELFALLGALRGKF